MLIMTYPKSHNSAEKQGGVGGNRRPLPVFAKHIIPALALRGQHPRSCSLGITSPFLLLGDNIPVLAFGGPCLHCLHSVLSVCSSGVGSALRASHPLSLKDAKLSEADRGACG